MPVPGDVDIVLASILMVAGVIGAQYGVRVGQKLRGEQLRALLALDTPHRFRLYFRDDPLPDLLPDLPHVERRVIRVPRPRSDHQHRPNRRFLARPIADPPFKLLDEGAHTISPSTCRAFRLLYSASGCHLQVAGLRFFPSDEQDIT